MITIAIIDEHPVLLTGLGQLLKGKFETFTILESDSIDSFHRSHPNQNPDLLILGLSENSESKDFDFKGKVIVYDYRANYSNALCYLKAGVNGYLSKQNDEHELTECIWKVLKGKRYICNEALDLIINESPKKKIVLPQAKLQLTFRENQIANFLCQGMKTSIIARTLERKPSTISTIKNNIYKKLDVNNVVQLMHAIRP